MKCTEENGVMIEPSPYMVGPNTERRFWLPDADNWPICLVECFMQSVVNECRKTRAGTSLSSRNRLYEWAWDLHTTKSLIRVETSGGIWSKTCFHDFLAARFGGGS